MAIPIIKLLHRNRCHVANIASIVTKFRMYGIWPYLHQCTKFQRNRYKTEDFSFLKKIFFYLTSRDEKAIRHTSNLKQHCLKVYRQGTFCIIPHVPVTTGSKVTAHYMVLYISGDLDLDLWLILIKNLQIKLEDKSDSLC